MKHKTFASMGEAEVNVTVEFDFTPGAPAKTYRPPEDCYPAEPFELEITAVYNEAMDEISGRLESDELDALAERVYDDADAWWPDANYEEETTHNWRKA